MCIRTVFCRFMYSVFFVNFLFLIFLLGSLFNRKMFKSFVGRFGIWSRYSNGIIPKSSKKRIWIHVSSAGELEQAKPLIRKINEKENSSAEVLLTYFSPSAERSANNTPGLIFSDYLPLDTYYGSKKLFDLIQPDIVVFVKFDIWPNIVWEAKKRNIPTLLIDGTLHKQSKRYSNFLGQAFYNCVYKSFNLIGVVSESDYKRFMISSPSHQNVKILGDTRYDQVAFRANGINLDKIPSSLEYYKSGITIICGSSWEADDKNILKPLRDLMEELPVLNIIMVPHEPNQSNIETYLKYFSAYAPLKLSNIRRGSKPSRVLVVDEVGCLAELYSIAHVAFVGGAFSTGVHNVMEPAIMGLAVVFGPRYYNSPEAEALIRMNTSFSCSNSLEFYECFKKLVCDSNFRKESGRIASEYIKSNLKADERYYREITKLF